MVKPTPTINVLLMIFPTIGRSPLQDHRHRGLHDARRGLNRLLHEEIKPNPNPGQQNEEKRNPNPFAAAKRQDVQGKKAKQHRHQGGRELQPPGHNE